MFAVYRINSNAFFAACSITREPPATSVSLFANAMSKPAEIAVSVGSSPTMPTTELMRISAFLSDAMSHSPPYRRAPVLANLPDAVSVLRIFQFRRCRPFSGETLVLAAQCINISIGSQCVNLHFVGSGNFQRLCSDRTCRSENRDCLFHFIILLLIHVPINTTRCKAKGLTSCGLHEPMQLSKEHRIHHFQCIKCRNCKQNAVKTIHDTAVSGHDISEVFDSLLTLQYRCTQISQYADYSTNNANKNQPEIVYMCVCDQAVNQGKITITTTSVTIPPKSLLQFSLISDKAYAFPEMFRQNRHQYRQSMQKTVPE